MLADDENDSLPISTERGDSSTNAVRDPPRKRRVDPARIERLQRLAKRFARLRARSAG